MSKHFSLTESLQMSVNVQCDACGKDHRVADNSAAKKFHCKGSQAVLTVSSPGPGTAKVAAPLKKPIRKKPVPVDVYGEVEVVDDEDDYLDALPTRRSSRRKSPQKRSRKSSFPAAVGSALAWAWNLDRIDRERYLAVAWVLAAFTFAVFERGPVTMSIMFTGMLAGIGPALNGAFWMWMEVFHVNKALWTSRPTMHVSIDDPN